MMGAKQGCRFSEERQEGEVAGSGHRRRLLGRSSSLSREGLHAELVLRGPYEYNYYPHLSLRFEIKF